MLIKAKLEFLMLLLFFSFLAAECYGLRRVDAEDEASAKYEECLNLCEPLEGQRCRKRCKEAYEERSRPSGSGHGWLDKCWKECEDRDEGIQTKFCKKSCETEYAAS